MYEYMNWLTDENFSMSDSRLLEICFKVLERLSVKKAFISFSQLSEDVMIKRVFGKINVTYIDIGCNHPIYGSVSFSSYLQGGIGLCIDINKGFTPDFKRLRPRDVFLSVGISNKTSERPAFFFKNSVTSTLSVQLGSAYVLRGQEVVSR